MTDTISEEKQNEDIRYLKVRALTAHTREEREQATRQAKMLEDALVVYKLVRSKDCN